MIGAINGDLFKKKRKHFLFQVLAISVNENEKSSQLMMFLMNKILDLRMKLLRIVRNK